MGRKTVLLGSSMLVLGTLLVQPLLVGLGFIILGETLDKKWLSIASVPLLLAFITAVGGFFLRLGLASFVLCYAFVVATGYCVYRALKDEDPATAKQSLAGSILLGAVIGYVLLLVASVRILRWGYAVAYVKEMQKIEG